MPPRERKSGKEKKGSKARKQEQQRWRSWGAVKRECTGAQATEAEALFVEN